MSASTMRGLVVSGLFASAVGLGGCVGAGISGATLAVKGSDRPGLFEDAEAGDPVAQYELGLANCCMGPGFSTQRATEWFCRSAQQGYAPAQYELGRVYSGEIARTPAPGQKIVGAIRARSEPVSAYVWYTLAAEGGQDKAVRRASDRGEKLTTEQLADADAKLSAWRDMPCTYSEVFGQETVDELEADT